MNVVCTTIMLSSHPSILMMKKEEEEEEKRPLDGGGGVQAPNPSNNHGGEGGNERKAVLSQQSCLGKTLPPVHQRGPAALVGVTFQIPSRPEMFALTLPPTSHPVLDVTSDFILVCVTSKCKFNFFPFSELLAVSRKDMMSTAQILWR